MIYIFLAIYFRLFSTFRQYCFVVVASRLLQFCYAGQIFTFFAFKLLVRVFKASSRSSSRAFDIIILAVATADAALPRLYFGGHLLYIKSCFFLFFVRLLPACSTRENNEVAASFWILIKESLRNIID